MDELLKQYYALTLSGGDVIHAALQDGYTLNESLMMLGLTNLNELVTSEMERMFDVFPPAPEQRCFVH